MHPRKLIRQAFKARAIGDPGEHPTSAEDRVFASMSPPSNLEAMVQEGAVICIYTGSEQINPEDYPVSGTDGSVRRTLTVSIECLVAGADADDKADDLAEVVEALFENWEVPGLGATEIRLIESQIDVTDGFEIELGGVLLTYEVKYWSSWRKDDGSSDFLADDALINGGASEAHPGPALNAVGGPFPPASPADLLPGGDDFAHGVEVV
jgi:hypothetical protein